MSGRIRWVTRRVRLGWTALLLGAAVVGLGAAGELAGGPAGASFRIMTAGGLVLLAVGIEQVVRFARARGDERVARSLATAAQDERAKSIRHAAGYRAYVVCASIVYIGLMWASFASSGRLPAISPDAVWSLLAAATVVPAGAYVASILIDERRS
jgi:hypothetical protein